MDIKTYGKSIAQPTVFVVPTARQSPQAGGIDS
jgi:hypothetical protein